MINLRFISEVALSGGKTTPTKTFMATTTDEDIGQAEKAYREWYNGQGFNREQADEVSDIVAMLTGAYEQKAHEDGFRLGVRLMIECLCPEAGYGVSSKT